MLHVMAVGVYLPLVEDQLNHGRAGAVEVALEGGVLRGLHVLHHRTTRAVGKAPS